MSRCRVMLTGIHAHGVTATDHPGVRATVVLGLAGTNFVLERQPGDRVDQFEQARL